MAFPFRKLITSATPEPLAGMHNSYNGTCKCGANFLALKFGATSESEWYKTDKYNYATNIASSFL